MKKLLLLFVAVCATFASCDKDDDNDKKFEGNAAAFVGTTWECVKTYTDSGTEYKDVMTFKFEKDNKFILNYTEYKKVDGNYVVVPGEGGSGEGRYSVDGKKLKLVAPDPETGVDSSLEAIINGTEFYYTEKDLDDEETFIFKLK